MLKRPTRERGTSIVRNSKLFKLLRIRCKNQTLVSISTEEIRWIQRKRRKGFRTREDVALLASKSLDKILKESKMILECLLTNRSKSVLLSSKLTNKKTKIVEWQTMQELKQRKMSLTRRNKMMRLNTSDASSILIARIVI